jgi:tetratricopeptide (TPR) repeat protein
MNEAPSIPASKPEKSASSAQANEPSSFQAAQNNQETSTIRTKPLQTEARRDADSLKESRLSPGSPHQEGVPEQNFIAPKKSTEYRSKPSGEATQAASSEHKDSQEADRDISDALKNAASEGLTERPGQTHEMQKRSENLLASQTPSSKGLTRKEESDAPVNPNTLEAQEWLKKSNDSIARDDTLETIVTASLAIKLDPTLVQAYLNRAWAFSERGLYDKAIMDLSHTLQMDPDNAYAYSRRGLIFERKGDDLKAIADYEKACKLGLELGCENQQKYASHLRD